MRVALHSIIREGMEAGYEAAHARVPDELAESFARLGIHDWTIWRSGDRLFHLVECDDFDAAMRALDTDAANARWQATIGEYVDHFELDGPVAAPEPLPQVWRLSEQ
jgi:L-rhamnose mutarotase